MIQNILITGASGFIGRQVLSALKNHKHNITLVLRPGSKNKIQDFNFITKIVETEDLFKESDEWWKKTCANIDLIIHLAWYAEPGMYLNSDKNIDCLLGTLNLAKGAINAGIKRFVGIGTCLEYDLSGEILSVDTPLMPLTPYGANKTAVFLTLLQLFSQKKIEFAWCRLFYLYGENEDKRRLISYVRSSIESGDNVELSNGNQVRDYMDVKDAGIRIAKVSIGNTQGPINICSGIPITVRDLVERVADEYGRRDLLKFGARPNNPNEPQTIIGK